MLLLFILIFFVSTAVFFGTYKLWSYLQLSSVLDREINHLWQRAPDKLKVVVERYLVLKFAGNKAHLSFFVWLLLATISAATSIINREPLVFMFFALVLLMVFNKRRTLWLKRNKTLVKELPDFCDLISMMMASGVPLILALEKVADSCNERLLASEINAVVQRLRRGNGFDASMKALSDGCDAKPIKEWVTMLVKGHQQGASLTKPLRFFAHQLRQELLNSAEKRAQEAPVKLLFPLVTCFFPVNFLVILGPIILQMSQGGFT
ncbi:type II secretion system F family protein [Idiomarina sp. UBA4520]|jgi:tight adherence protein C|uniref:type II secretion system F family protein n=1 Tax=Idiomarina sp. UBA4520 TaxID=1946647 RepID=UPI000AA9F7B1|nr:type II secretion system F family protein [Idiomarina sp. UBA4520]MBF38474.1 pilus assembly protein TadC [Idiomarinaceae bacterium]|tara:strand:+ start:35486 stop:36277 length:792 start_codon:yes stop_codon:yes gene_type:complete